MPELPEIETIRRDLAELLEGQVLRDVRVLDRRLMDPAGERLLQKHVVGNRWERIERRGKYLLVFLENGYSLVFHLRMTGQLVVAASGGAATGYRAWFRFENGQELGFYDQRRFGDLFLVPPGEQYPSVARLGPEPLGGITRDEFVRAVRQKTTRIKPLLMDQAFLAGVGNIYAQEALFRAGIRPGRSGKALTKAEAEKLFDALQYTLELAIRHRGSSSRNYRDAQGRQGEAQKLHLVYRKSGAPCPTCKTILRGSRVGGRGTVYCARCQK